AHAQVDGRARQYVLGQIDEHAVAHLRRVVEAQDRQGDAQRPAEVFVDALAADATAGVFSHRLERVCFEGAAADHRRHAVDVAGAEGDDATAAKVLADRAGQEDVDGPRPRLLTRRAALHADAEEAGV